MLRQRWRCTGLREVSASSLRVPPEFLWKWWFYSENSAVLQTIRACLPKVNGWENPHRVVPFWEAPQTEVQPKAEIGHALSPKFRVPPSKSSGTDSNCLRTLP